jgi:hypothetical protein
MNSKWLLIVGVLNLVFIVCNMPTTVIVVTERVLAIAVCFVWLRGVVQACIFNTLHLVSPMRIVHPAIVVRQSVGMMLYGAVMWSIWYDESVVQMLIYASYRPVASIVITAVLVSALRNMFGLAFFYQDYRTEVLRVVVVLEMYVCVVMAYPYGIQGLRFAMDTCVGKLKLFHG